MHYYQQDLEDIEEWFNNRIKAIRKRIEEDKYQRDCYQKNVDQLNEYIEKRLQVIQEVEESKNNYLHYKQTTGRSIKL